MKSFNEKLTILLKKDSRFIDDNKELIRPEIVNEVLKMDKELISMLLGNKEVKEKFFSEIKGHWIFEMNKFIDYIQDKNFLNDSYTKYKNKIGLSIGDKLMKERREVVLSFPFKDCILEGGQTQEEDKRKEIFFNEILAQDEIDRLLEPKVLTNFKKYNIKGGKKIKDIKRDSEGFIRENLIIKGNNLLALYSIKRQFQGKIKLIYIDPPYNTGNDSFGYNDNFNHSTWLTFMKNRLEVARDLLNEEGSIFIQCDDNEQAYLKILCDEIFGREHFINQISWLRTSSGKTISKKLSNDVDYILWYSKSDNYAFKPTYKPLSEKTKAMYRLNDDDGRGKYRLYPLQKTGGPGPKTTYDYKDNNGKIWKCPVKGWRMIKEKLKALENDGRLFLKGNTLGEKAYWDERDNEGKIANNLWEDIPNLQGSNKEFHNFSGQKPEKLIKRIIEMTTENNDVVLDYHLGSGTTSSVAHKMGRQYIGIEQLHYEKNGSVIRLKNVIKGDVTGISKEVNWKGGGNFIYCELARYNDDFIEKIYKAKSTKELFKIWEMMKEKSFINYNIDIKIVEEHMKEFKQLPISKQKETLILMLNKNQLYINLSEIEDSHFKISKEDKELNEKFYG